MRTSRLPPARGLMANIFRSVVQTAWDVAQGALSGVGTSAHPTDVVVDADNGYLLAQGWRTRYAGLFREIKVHKVEAWYMPYAQSTDPGLYTFTISDYGENAISNGAGMAAIGVPGTVCRRMNQTAYACWYPTEPSDREWQLISDDHKWLTYTIKSAETGYWVHADANREAQHQASLAGKVIINTHASFRGKGDGRIANGFCGCNKCIRINARRIHLEEEREREEYEVPTAGEIPGGEDME